MLLCDLIAQAGSSNANFGNSSTDCIIAVLICQAAGICNACFGNSSTDCIIAGLIYQAASQIKLIKATLRDIIKHADEYVSKFGDKLTRDELYKFKNQYIYDDICKCVKRYNLIKDFVNDIENTFSIALFWQFGASVFVICLGFVQFLFVELWTFDFFTIVSFVITMSWEVFLYCYYGSLLSNESDTLITDIYITNWLDLDLKCQKAYLIIMENGKKPIVIRAGKIIDLSLDTFATIIRRSYSVLAIISKLIDN
ncbi:odorant receptor 2a-like [Rhynchophorus ferrugineus]|uniref:odorant receptor 2a-like n=1 Tax=Rhynchophorus ferrugineus TaxID=354439 RepID=UPI003FCD4E6F